MRYAIASVIFLLAIVFGVSWAVEWLLGRAFRDRDRSPAYTKIKSIFAGRLGGMGFGRPALPIVDWASH